MTHEADGKLRTVYMVEVMESIWYDRVIEIHGERETANTSAATWRRQDRQARVTAETVRWYG